MMARRPRSGPYLFGDRFTLADIALYPWFEQSDVLEQLSEFRLPLAAAGSPSGARPWASARPFGNTREPLIGMQFAIAPISPHERGCREVGAMGGDNVRSWSHSGMIEG
ncbi:hypothetical protein CQ13_20725 [Bradyrhizobium retamae]|uniref:GST C-terminal domain-containing protein n=1 Tax=Bradyrhizobium retamae TaxID=1300035 RepID=A0A0R3NFH9_9BRAD|nr:hypothetical protein CQ13_20725 [Bradyrhizobium retamae]